MKINFATLAFGYSIGGTTDTPSWETPLGQGKGYKININSSIDEILRGMIYSMASNGEISTKLGRGGGVVRGDDENSKIKLGSVFSKVYINDKLINDGKFILLITQDQSDSHYGRLFLKYSIHNTHNDGKVSYSNRDFFDKVAEQLELANNACWFVYDISIRNQDELILNTIFVNKYDSMEYIDKTHFRNSWKSMLDNINVEYDPINRLIGENLLIYGVPGCGKSHYIKERYTINDDNSERVVFHPDYTYSDFVGQILPKVKMVQTTPQPTYMTDYTSSDTASMMIAETPVAYGANKSSVEYEFTPGPFTRLLKRCKKYDDIMHYLVIEEINRGNAPAIFGEIFQLLDRDENGESEYGISNSDIAREVYGDPNKKVIIPNNLTVFATMNTADQNVFILDTAFKRRWEMLSIRNNFKMRDNDDDFNSQLGCKLCGTALTWMHFATVINTNILEQSGSNLGSEDKRLGHFFVKRQEMKDVYKFSEKIIMYLWNDVFKFEKENVFNLDYKTLEDVLDAFQNPQIRFKIFADKLGFSKFIVVKNHQEEGETDE